MFIEEVLRVVSDEFGNPVRQTVKVDAWEVRRGLSIVIQKDSPKNGEYANVWLPYPADSSTVPEIALEYSGESGRHSNTYPSSGLEKGNPVLKLRVSSKQELKDLIAYVEAFKSHQPLPEINSNPDYCRADEHQTSILIDTSKMPIAKPIKPRRQAIPRDVQREVWQRDGGQCVQCESKTFLCFDHIVPHSKGGSNSIRNLQLLCEKCNLSKGNRI
ncbi:HNH endonuclease [Shewanella sp.]|uniref:HNH endonuclease n=1 Tax=Shewanella sp. TaxID=50422 RepID=UPI004048B5D5